jgi:3-hydroxyacyl-[acyl-carrier-protein] dehydratase
MNNQHLIASLPHGPGFRFVDQILSVDQHRILGQFTFKADMAIFADHFPGRPVVPGVMLIECAAQIALGCHGVFLAKEEQVGVMRMTSAQADFILAVLPGETITVEAFIIYFRFNKIKTQFRITNQQDKEVCSGVLSGMSV